MKLFVITESRTQSKFINKYGETAEPTTRVLGIRSTKTSAENFKKRMAGVLTNQAYIDNDTETITVEITTIDMPD